LSRENQLHQVQNNEADLNTRKKSRFEVIIIAVKVNGAVLGSITISPPVHP